jgi:hypothetical protein
MDRDVLMPGKRADGKRNFGGWILAGLYDRVAAIAGKREITHTDVLNEALADWLDRHERETTQTTGEQ